MEWGMEITVLREHWLTLTDALAALRCLRSWLHFPVWFPLEPHWSFVYSVDIYIISRSSEKRKTLTLEETAIYVREEVKTIPKKYELRDACVQWGITPFSVTNKAFCSWLMNRTKEVIEANQWDEQAGFRPKRWCVNHIFALKTQEKMSNSKKHMPQMSKILKNIWQHVLRLTLDHLK